MSVFQVDKDFKVILNPEAVRLVPELSTLTNDETLYVVCVMDYESGPFRKKPIDERRLLSIRKFFKGKKWEDIETPRIKTAMAGYKDLVFDIRRETIDKYKRRILNFQKESLADETDLRKLKELDSAITFLTTRVDTLQHELDIEEQSEDIKIQGGRRLTQLEKWQRSQKAHREFKDSL